jgi:transposase InsO family protein
VSGTHHGMARLSHETVHGYRSGVHLSYSHASWVEENNVELEFIKPEKPIQNSYIERFNRTYRDEILNIYVFKKLAEVREITIIFINDVSTVYSVKN